MSECKRSTEAFKIKEKGKTNRVLLNGYWIWWCYQHHQPVAWCEKHNLKQQRDDLLEASEKFLVEASAYLPLPDEKYCPPLIQIARKRLEAAIAKCS